MLTRRGGSDVEGSTYVFVCVNVCVRTVFVYRCVLGLITIHWAVCVCVCVCVWWSVCAGASEYCPPCALLVSPVTCRDGGVLWVREGL